MPSARDFAFVGCRLLALYIGFHVVQSIAFGGFFLFTALTGPEEYRSDRLLETSFQHASVATGLLAFLILWFGAGWIAGKVAAGAPAAQGTWSPRIVLAVAVVFFGLAVLYWTLPQLSYLLQGLVAHRGSSWPALLSVIVGVAVGLGCILGAQGIANAISRLRGW